MYSMNKLFSRFPKNEEMQTKWLQMICSSAKPTKHSRVCSEHFLLNDIFHLSKRTEIRLNAFPQLKLRGKYCNEVNMSNCK